MTTLLIIESPGKKKKLESILGPGYVVRASFGHIRDLPENEIGVSAPDYRPKYVVSDSRSKATVAELRKAAQGASDVLLATDPDREGEAIAWHVADVLHLSAPKRVTYQSITAKAVKDAVATPRALDMDLVHAQEARRVLDRLVGYDASPALSIKAGRKLSAGRVQSPAVRLVVERERAIRSFTATTHFGASLGFTTPHAWEAEWDSKPFLGPDEEYLLDRAMAEAAASARRVVVKGCEDSTAHVNPPAPFTTSTLQQAAQKNLRMKPKQTMMVAQKLYEQGAITYMRTDSPNLSEEAFHDIAAYAASQNLPLANGQRTWKAKGGSQEAHEAIRPTHVECGDAGENADEQALYRLIWQRAVASQLEAAEYAVRTATLESIEPIDADRTAIYIARGRTLVDAGWKALYGAMAEDDEEGAGDGGEGTNVPKLVAGAELDVATGKVLTKETKPPKRYTQATLVQALERRAIGRPSTYASILDNITRRGYITEDKKGLLAATEAAEAIVDGLVGTCTFIDLDYTKDLENDLDAVAGGKKSYRDVVATAHAILAQEVASLAPQLPTQASETHPCPECGSALRYRMGSRGGFWGCSNYPKCKVTLPDDDGTPGERQADGEPSEAQVRFARNLASRHSVELPDNLETSRNVCKAFIDKYAEPRSGRSKSARAPRKAGTKRRPRAS